MTWQITDAFLLINVCVLSWWNISSAIMFMAIQTAIPFCLKSNMASGQAILVSTSCLTLFLTSWWHMININWIFPRHLILSHSRDYLENASTVTSMVIYWTGSLIFLSGHTRYVVVDGAVSSWSAVDSGVPQGTVLDPLLFLLYINDWPDCVESQVHLFKDNCLL